MKNIWSYLLKNPLMFLIIALPAAIIVEVAHWNPLIVFILSAIGVIPMAGLIGKATEILAEYSGPKIGGLLNATPPITLFR